MKDSNNIILRASIIGFDINKKGIGVFKWFMDQEGSVNGWSNVMWNGVTHHNLLKL